MALVMGRWPAHPSHPFFGCRTGLHGGLSSVAYVGANRMAKGGKDENGKSIAAKNLGAKAMAKGGKDENGKSIAAKNLGAKMHGALGHISWPPLFLLVDAWLEENCGQGRRPHRTWEKVLAHLRQLPEGAHLPPSITSVTLQRRYSNNKCIKEKKEKKEKEEKEEEKEEKEE